MSIAKKRANEYIGHAREVDEGYEITQMRDAFVAGYEQAVKDHSLTAEDVRIIFNKVRTEAVKWSATEACFPDVAEWFNKEKAKEQ